MSVSCNARGRANKPKGARGRARYFLRLDPGKGSGSTVWVRRAVHAGAPTARRDLGKHMRAPHAVHGIAWRGYSSRERC